MMSPNVRRLVLDPSPRLQLGIGLILWVISGLMAALWMHGNVSPNFFMIFMTWSFTLGVTQKASIWRILPVSAKDLGQAQWWCLWGLPFLAVLITVGIAASVAAGFGWLGVSGADICVYAGAELTLIFLMGTILPVPRFLRSTFGPSGTVTGTIVLIVAILSLAFRWTGVVAFSTLRPEILAGTAVSVTLVAVAYGLSARIPITAPNTRQLKPPKSQASPPTATAKSAIGWNALFRLALKIALTVLRTAAVVTIALLLLSAVTPLTKTFDTQDILQYVPLVGTLAAIGYVPALSQRVLAGLPLSALQRTLMLHLMSVTIQLPVFGAMMIVTAMANPYAVSGTWVIARCLFVLMAVSFAAAMIAVALRFGQKNVVWFYGLAAMPGAFGNVALNSLDTGEPTWLGIDMANVPAILTLAFLAIYGLSVIWTYLELAFGRAAYHYQPLAQATWRGSGS
ncbi:hypothetical protein AEAC466_19810 [Asticcacaulis sp. AC466]|uniref:hypothetical protein n=1 Tax=Asticcacaulis sp. AC466 TaxID=1282362 RepID=UPI0003C3AF8E|nr:hypothetical protein [Asticcacaulis sp. AC466]ESQ81811.1 hypothetical protein AEAC466_19810 [Asticcacaulis sp. AC466]